MTKKNFLISVIFLIVATSCNNKKSFSIVVVDKTLDLGVLSIDDTVQKTIYIKNVSNVDLKINSIATSCECTIPSFDENLIKTNDSAYVNIKYIPESKGQFKKQIIIDVNTESSFIPLSLIGTVE